MTVTIVLKGSPEEIGRQRAIFQMTAKQKPTLALIKQILSTHEEEKGAFCNDGNQMTTIAVPQAGKLLLSGYLPCKSKFTEYRF